MHIFITGASGYVGSVVVEKALERGHTVTGLARSEASAKKLEKMGVKPLRADLTDTTALTEQAKKSDAVLHLGFVHEFDRPYEELLAIDIAAIKAFGAGFKGTNKALVTTSGTGVIAPDDGQETTEESPLQKDNPRVRAETATTELAKDGVRAMVIRLSPYVFGRGGSYFLPALIHGAAKAKFAPYIGDGSVMTTTADVDSAAELYILAMEKGQAGSVYNCSTETDVRLKDLAEGVAESLDIPTQSVDFKTMSELVGPFTAAFGHTENRASSAKARKELDWQPSPKFNMIDDVKKGSYQPMVASLKKESAPAR